MLQLLTILLITVHYAAAAEKPTPKQHENEGSSNGKRLHLRYHESVAPLHGPLEHKVQNGVDKCMDQIRSAFKEDDIRTIFHAKEFSAYNCLKYAIGYLKITVYFSNEEDFGFKYFIYLFGRADTSQIYSPCRYCVFLGEPTQLKEKNIKNYKRKNCRESFRDVNLNAHHVFGDTAKTAFEHIYKKKILADFPLGSFAYMYFEDLIKYTHLPNETEEPYDFCVNQNHLIPEDDIVEHDKSMIQDSNILK